MPSFRKTALSLLLVSSQISGSAAFTPQKATTVKAPIAAGVESVTSLASTKEEAARYTYGERSREFRRTVYSHDDWVKHRSTDRFYKNLSTIFQSGVTINLGKEVLTTTSVAAFIIGWNCIFGEYQDFNFVTHAGPMKDSVIPVLALPLSVFTLASPSLGLLLGT